MIAKLNKITHIFKSNLVYDFKKLSIIDFFVNL